MITVITATEVAAPNVLKFKADTRIESSRRAENKIAIFVGFRSRQRNGIFFIVEDASEGGYTVKALGESIYTDADNFEELHANVQDAVRCHFDEDKKPKMIHLHFVHEVM